MHDANYMPLLRGKSSIDSYFNRIKSEKRVTLCYNFIIQQVEIISKEVTRNVHLTRFVKAVASSIFQH